MRSVRTYVTVVFSVLALAIAIAQTQKVTTPEELDKTMKAINQANGAMRKAIQSSAFDDAKAQLVIVRTNITNAENFWVIKKKDDAQGFSKNVRTKLDALETALGASPVDSAAVMAAFKEVGGGCQTCHMEYREADPAGGFRIKPGKIDGM